MIRHDNSVTALVSAIYEQARLEYVKGRDSPRDMRYGYKPAGEYRKNLLSELKEGILNFIPHELYINKWYREMIQYQTRIRYKLHKHYTKGGKNNAGKKEH